MLSSFLSAPSLRDQQKQFGQSLSVIPVRNPSVRASEPPERPGTLLLEVQLHYRTPLLKFFRKLFGASEVKTYRLDKIGTKVFNAIDGKKTFEEMIDEFAAKEKLSFFESRALLAQFMRMLTDRGIIVATLPKHPSSTPSEHVTNG